MPLIRGYSERAVYQNARELRARGYPHKQAIAIVYDVARKALRHFKQRETKRRQAMWKRTIARAFKADERARRRLARSS